MIFGLRLLGPLQIQIQIQFRIYSSKYTAQNVQSESTAENVQSEYAVRIYSSQYSSLPAEIGCTWFVRHCRGVLPDWRPKLPVCCQMAPQRATPCSLPHPGQHHRQSRLQICGPAHNIPSEYTAQNIQLRICSQNIQLRIYNSEYMYLLAVAGAAQLQHRGEHQRRGVEVGVAGGCRARDGIGPDHAQRFPSRVLPRGPPLQSPCTARKTQSENTADKTSTGRQTYLG